MAKGENIFKRKDGRWEARYIKGYEVSGKIKYGFCYGKTYKEAKEKVMKYKTEVYLGKPILSAKKQKIFGAYCDAWLDSVKYTLKESTYVKYDSILQCHIKPKLGNYYPLGFSAEIFSDFTNELLEKKKLSPKTTKDILVVLHSVLKYTEKEFSGSFPSIELVYPKEQKKEMRVLSQEEQEKFTSYLLEDMDACKFGILLSAFTGLRIGEICALRWKNISLKEKTIKIDGTMQRLKNSDSQEGIKTKVLISSPKSGKSMRVIPMTDCLTNFCKKHQVQNLDAFVLTGSTDYMEPRVLQYRLKKYTAECGLEGVHFHSLRHTFATRCIEVGFEIKSLSEILGHANTSITMNCYVHPSLELKRKNMEKLNMGEW